jgi:hypothetical protein
MPATTVKGMELEEFHKNSEPHRSARQEKQMQEENTDEARYTAKKQMTKASRLRDTRKIRKGVDDRYDSL